MRKRFYILAFASTLFATAALCAQDTLEYKLQTAFIYQFTSYIEWLPNAAPGADGFKIGVIGDSPITPLLEELATKKKAKGAPIVVKRVDVRESLTEYHILVIANPALADAIVAKVKDKPVLTIAKGDQLLDRGVTINFVVENGKLRFEINKKLADNNNLFISSQLLKLARVPE